MSKYIISFEVSSQGVVNSMMSALLEEGIVAEMLSSVWLYKSNNDLDTIYESLMTHIEVSDKLFVGSISKDAIISNQKCSSSLLSDEFDFVFKPC